MIAISTSTSTSTFSLKSGPELSAALDMVRLAAGATDRNDAAKRLQRAVQRRVDALPRWGAMPRTDADLAHDVAQALRGVLRGYCTTLRRRGAHSSLMAVYADILPIMLVGDVPPVDARDLYRLGKCADFCAGAANVLLGPLGTSGYTGKARPPRAALKVLERAVGRDYWQGLSVLFWELMRSKKHSELPTDSTLLPQLFCDFHIPFIPRITAAMDMAWDANDKGQRPDLVDKAIRMVCTELLALCEYLESDTEHGSHTCDIRAGVACAQRQLNELPKFTQDKPKIENQVPTKSGI